MIHLFSGINWISVVAAFAGYFFLGPLWYMFLFKKQYLVSLGKEDAPDQKPEAIYVAGPALCSLVITITTASLMHALNIDSFAAAWQLAAVVGIGYLFTNTVNIGINPNIPKPLLYGALSGAFHLVGIFIVCTILYAMK